MTHQPLITLYYSTLFLAIGPVFSRNIITYEYKISFVLQIPANPSAQYLCDDQGWSGACWERTTTADYSRRNYCITLRLAIIAVDTGGLLDLLVLK